MKIDSFKDWLIKIEAAGGDAIVNSCKPTADAQVFGACSDLQGKQKKKCKKR